MFRGCVSAGWFCTCTVGAPRTTGALGGDLTAGDGLLPCTSAEEMPLCCQSHMRIRFTLIFVLFFTDLNGKSNALGQKTSSNKTSRYAPGSLLLLTEYLQLETCSFRKIPMLSQPSPGNTLLLLDSLEAHSLSPLVTRNGARFAAFCWFHKQLGGKRLFFQGRH